MEEWERCAFDVTRLRRLARLRTRRAPDLASSLTGAVACDQAADAASTSDRLYWALVGAKTTAQVRARLAVEDDPEVLGELLDQFGHTRLVDAAVAGRAVRLGGRARLNAVLLPQAPAPEVDAFVEELASALGLVAAGADRQVLDRLTWSVRPESVAARLASSHPRLLVRVLVDLPWVEGGGRGRLSSSVMLSRAALDGGEHLWACGAPRRLTRALVADVADALSALQESDPVGAVHRARLAGGGFHLPLPVADASRSGRWSVPVLDAWSAGRPDPGWLPAPVRRDEALASAAARLWPSFPGTLAQLHGVLARLAGVTG